MAKLLSFPLICLGVLLMSSWIDILQGNSIFQFLHNLRYHLKTCIGEDYLLIFLLLFLFVIVSVVTTMKRQQPPEL